MARLRYNGLAATLGAALTSSGTTITFAAALTHSGGTAVPTISGGDYIPLTILTSAGAVSEIVSLTAYTSGATTGTITRAQESTTGVAHASGDAVVHSATAADFASSGGGGILATKSYDPGTQTDLSTTATTDGDVDATNLAVTFTAPASGKVIVHLAALGEQPTSGGGVFWTLREGTATIKRRYITTARAANFDFAGAVSFLITGLTPGSSYTYKWGHYVTSGTSKVRVGGTLGPAVMEVHSAP